MKAADHGGNERDRRKVRPAPRPTAPADKTDAAPESRDEEPVDGDAVEAAASAAAFGPAFFTTQLAAFVRDRCPDPSEALPSVELHLVGGESLDVCHVIRMAASWVALAVNDREASEFVSMRTEILPYAQICRATIRAFQPSTNRVGFTLSASAHVATHVNPAGARPLG